MQKLVGEMDEGCKVAQDAAPLRDQSQRSNDIVLKILLQVVQCTYFVKEYCSERRFGMYECTSRVLLSFMRVYLGGRLLRDMTSLADQQAKDYIENLQKLRSSLSEHANVSTAVMVHRVCGELQNIGRAIPSSSHLPFNH